MQFLTKNEFIRMFIFAKDEIERKKEEINKINIFPVPDHDTGRNLFETLKGISKAIKKNKNKPFKEFLEKILEGALISSQGNSGLIFASFLAGFLEKLISDEGPVDAKKFSSGLEKGYQRAKESVERPKEGTIFDVISSFCETFKKELKLSYDIIFLFKRALKRARKALVETQNKFSLFQKAGIVDAGALGMFLIFKGWFKGISEENQFSSLNYEVIFLMKNPKNDAKYFRKKFSMLGDSLEILQFKNFLKVHLHTNFPEKVIEIAKKEGEMINLKIEKIDKKIK